MRFWITLIVVIFCWSPGNSQVSLLTDGSLPYDTSSNWLVELDLSREDLGNALEREILQKFVFGGRISSEMIENSSTNLRSKNRYLGILNGGISLAKFRNQKNFGWLFSYQLIDQINLRFTRDFYQLLFRGNTYFGNNEVAELGLTAVDRTSYQKFSFGLIEQESGSFASISFVHAFNILDYSVEELQLSTQYEGEGSFNIPVEVHLNANNYNSLDSEDTNGFGIAFNGTRNHKLKLGTIRVSIEDFGFTYWDNLERSDTTGAYTYDGFDWIYGEDNEIDDFFKNLGDSLNPNVRDEDAWRLLPFRIQVQFYSRAEKKLFTSFGAQYRYVPDLLPSLFGRLNYRLKEGAFLWLHAGAGGASVTNLGFGAQLGIKESLVLTVGSNHLGGILSPNATSLSAYVRIQWQL